MHLTSRGDTLRRITKAALGGLAGCALVLGGTQVAVGVIDTYHMGSGATRTATLPISLALRRRLGHSITHQ